ncbi:hypothetical protein BV22DRAFT_1045300 [Leucogyrophana mollusca]|uniref:Uncharacterized protein n=1 Tax=Leucogyrophana mollusca TaxID=85980 RepID=A0ACB8BQ31_9AGAM|nr:hypothetical protein BV22DRAFT_1045300 [Leucogyrophana mollusca]
MVYYAVVAADSVLLATTYQHELPAQKGNEARGRGSAYARLTLRRFGILSERTDGGRPAFALVISVVLRTRQRREAVYVGPDGASLYAGNPVNKSESSNKTQRKSTKAQRSSGKQVGPTLTKASPLHTPVSRPARHPPSPPTPAPRTHAIHFQPICANPTSGFGAPETVTVGAAESGL